MRLTQFYFEVWAVFVVYQDMFVCRQVTEYQLPLAGLEPRWLQRRVIRVTLEQQLTDSMNLRFHSQDSFLCF